MSVNFFEKAPQAITTLSNEKFSDSDFKIDSGDRIAQMVIAKHETVSWKSVDKLDDSLRGDKGFGSTGK